MFYFIWRTNSKIIFNVLTRYLYNVRHNYENGKGLLSECCFYLFQIAIDGFAQHPERLVHLLVANLLQNIHRDITAGWQSLSALR